VSGSGGSEGVKDERMEDERAKDGTVEDERVRDERLHSTILLIQKTSTNILPQVESGGINTNFTRSHQIPPDSGIWWNQMTPPLYSTRSYQIPPDPTRFHQIPPTSCVLMFF
jgi:hypothetical protein